MEVQAFISCKQKTASRLALACEAMYIAHMATPACASVPLHFNPCLLLGSLQSRFGFASLRFPSSIFLYKECEPGGAFVPATSSAVAWLSRFSQWIVGFCLASCRQRLCRQVRHSSQATAKDLRCCLHAALSKIRHMWGERDRPALPEGSALHRGHWPAQSEETDRREEEARSGEARNCLDMN